METKVKYNQISKKLLEEADAVLSRFDTKKFVTTNRKWNETQKRWNMSVKENIPPKCRIYDPYAVEVGKGKYEGKEIDIAFEIGTGVDGMPKLGELLLERSNAGEIVCNGKKTRDAAKYQYLKLCIWNRDNKDKKWQGSPMKYIFREDDVVKKAKKSVADISIKAEAVVAITKMGHGELTEYCRGLGKPTHSNADVMRDGLIKFSDHSNDNAKRILNLVNDTEVKFIGDITYAEELKIVKYSKNAWRWFDGDSSFCSVTKGRDEKKELYNFFLTNDGEAVYAQMLEMIDEAEKKNEK